MHISWETVAISFAVALVTGGLAGAVLTLIFTPRVQRAVQRNTLRAAGKNDAIQAIVAWTSKTHLLYMENEAKWAGGNRAASASRTLWNSEFIQLRTLADLKVKITFANEDYVHFKNFADWLEKSLNDAFAGSELFAMPEFHRRVEAIVTELTQKVWV